MEHTGMNLVQTSNMQRAAAVEVTAAMAGLHNMQAVTMIARLRTAVCLVEEEAEEIRQWHLRNQQADHFMVQAVAVALGVTLASKMGLMATRALSTCAYR